MYNLEEFSDVISAKVLEIYEGKGIAVEVKKNTVVKNNGIEYHGLSILEEGSNIAPNIYLDELYKSYMNGMSIEEIIEEVFALSERNQKPDIDISNINQFADFDLVKNRIVYRLVNFEKNEEMLQDRPYEKFLDMALVYYYIGEATDEMGSIWSISIKNEHLKMWGVEKDELLRVAAANTPVLLAHRISSLNDVIKDIMVTRMSQDSEEVETVNSILDAVEYSNPVHMYVLSNTKNMYGASVILYRNVLKDIAEQIGQKKLYILPSSIHETLLVPGDLDEDVDCLHEMVQEVNRTSVEDGDILSDHVYIYDSETDEVNIAA